MKFILPVMLAFILIYCKSENTPAKKVRDNVASYLKSHGQAGEDFEFVSVTDVDTVTFKEYSDRELEVLTLGLMNKNIRLKKLDSIESITKNLLIKNPKDETAATNLQDITRSKTAIYVQQHRLDSLTAAMKPELGPKIKFIGADYAFKSKDAKGGKITHHFYVKLDENLNVLSASTLDH